VPVTVAAHCAVAPVLSVDGLQATLTEVMVDPGGGGGADFCTVMDALPDIEGSWALVAVMVTVWAAEGAVKEPLAEMAPELAVHVTAVL
jgi:hypothetical protein